MSTFMLGAPAGPVIVDGETRIQMVDDTKLEHRPAEAIPYLERIISERSWPYSVQEFLESIIKVHRSALPPPQLINAEIVFPAARKSVADEMPDSIPVPKSYNRNRRRK